MNPDDPRHGTHRGYVVGCRDECCTRAHTRYMKLYRLGRTNRLIDPTGTVRRIQALYALGWTAKQIGDYCGRSDEWPRHIVNESKQVSTRTALLIAGAYEHMCMTIPLGPYAKRCRREATAKGYLPPLAWDDIDTDEAPAVQRCAARDCKRAPSRRGWCEMHYRRWQRTGDAEGVGRIGRPRGMAATYNAVHLRLKREKGVARSHWCPCGSVAATWSYDHSDPNEEFDGSGRPYSLDLGRYQPLCIACHNKRDKAARKARNEAALIDPIVVERLLAGERIRATKGEKDEAMRRWLSWGRSEKSLCAIHGWHDGRYGLGEAS